MRIDGFRGLILLDSVIVAEAFELRYDNRSDARARFCTHWPTHQNLKPNFRFQALHRLHTQHKRSLNVVHTCAIRPKDLLQVREYLLKYRVDS